MKFSELQARLQELSQDDSTAWAVGWTSNKAAINRARKNLFDMLKHSHAVSRWPSAKTAEVSVTNGVGALPADFDTDVAASLHTISTATAVESDVFSRFYDYEIFGEYGTKQVHVDSWVSKINFAYVPWISDLADPDDVPSEIPSELHECVADYALVEYFRAQRDNAEAMNALNIAQSYLNDRLSRLW